MANIQTFDELKTLQSKNRRKATIAISSTVILCFLFFFLCMGVGNYDATIIEIVQALFGIGDEGTVYIMKEVRLPRVLAAAFVGAALSIAGLTMQSLFKNPMASPSIRWRCLIVRSNVFMNISVSCSIFFT